jgi:hypothetical protein
MHMDVSQERFYARIYRKKAGEQRAYPDLTLAWTLTVRTLQCGQPTHCLGKKKLRETARSMSKKTFIENQMETQLFDSRISMVIDCPLNRPNQKNKHHKV